MALKYTGLSEYWLQDCRGATALAVVAGVPRSPLVFLSPVGVSATPPSKFLSILKEFYLILLKSGVICQLIITMSMTVAGVISRLCDEVFSSAMTFGMVGLVSAPGQIPVK